jgi:hypothetical protein
MKQCFEPEFIFGCRSRSRAIRTSIKTTRITGGSYPSYFYKRLHFHIFADFSIILAHFQTSIKLFKNCNKIKQKFFGHMVEPVQKNTNEPLIQVVCDVIFVCWQNT